MRKLTTNEWIEKAKKVHGDKYDYSKAEYINTMTKICIICPTHGEFWQTPNNHLRGKGCPQCAIIKVKSKNSNATNFIMAAKNVHGDKYDYSKVNYINNRTKVSIICPLHGEFWQRPMEHLKGCGCPKCKGKNMTTDEWIEKAREVHGDKYDYSKVEYERSNKKVCIICPTHGEFWQRPNAHLCGRGCWKCYKDKKVYNTLQFIEAAKKVHGDKYNYSKVEYVNNRTKVCIICPTHGEFWQRPMEHLKGKGCYVCNQSHLEKECEEILLKNKIIFEKEKKFDWLGKQRIDFYLKDYNAAIECQGLQHFEAVDYFGGIKRLHEIEKSDYNKLEKCKKKNIEVYYYTSDKILRKIKTKADIYCGRLFTDMDKILKLIK